MESRELNMCSDVLAVAWELVCSVSWPVCVVSVWWSSTRVFSASHSARRASTQGWGGQRELHGPAGVLEASSAAEAARTDPRLSGGLLTAGERRAARTAHHTGCGPSWGTGTHISNGKCATKSYCKVTKIWASSRFRLVLIHWVIH